MEVIKKLSKSETYLKKDLYGNLINNEGGGKQVSYNVPKKLIDVMLNSGVIEPYDSNRFDRKVWTLSDKYNFDLRDNVYILIGNKYKDVKKNFFVSEGIGNTKWQMFKRIYDYAGGLSNKWFVDLYDSAYQGAILIFELDTIKKELYIDIKL